MLEIKTDVTEAAAKILVVGVGGAGNNAVNRMIEEQIAGVEGDTVRFDLRPKKVFLFHPDTEERCNGSEPAGG